MNNLTSENKFEKRFSMVDKIRNAGIKAMAFMSPTVLMATTAMAATGPSTTTMENIVEAVGGVLLTIFQFMGVFVLLLGVYMIIMGQRADDPERKSKGLNEALIGAVLVGLKPLINFVLSKTGMNVQF